MKLANMPEGVTDWSQTAAVSVGGVCGTAAERTRRVAEVRMRIVDYAPGYLADHWCSKGHVLYVIAGALTIEHQDARPACALSAGMSWHVADDPVPAHRVRCEQGARVFIVD